MAIRSREELMSAIKNRIGDDVSDEAISLMEDVSDTLSDYDSRVGEDWKTKYEENDRSWRQRYAERFMSGNTDSGQEQTVIADADHTDLEEPEKLTYESLFETQ